MLYTGGTTGMPKGVMWRHEDVFFGAMGGAGGGGTPISTPEQIEDRCRVRADVSKVQLGPGGELLATPRRERVEHVHLVAAGDQRLRDMRADEARSACHDRPQGLVS